MCCDKPEPSDEILSFPASDAILPLSVRLSLSLLGLFPPVDTSMQRKERGKIIVCATNAVWAHRPLPPDQAQHLLGTDQLTMICFCCPSQSCVHLCIVRHGVPPDWPLLHLSLHLAHVFKLQATGGAVVHGCADDSVLHGRRPPLKLGWRDGHCRPPPLRLWQRGCHRQQLLLRRLWWGFGSWSIWQVSAMATSRGPRRSVSFRNASAQTGGTRSTSSLCD